MDRNNKNKENIARNGCISNMFKVKKCLFDQSISRKVQDSNSPKTGQHLVTDSPMSVSPSIEDSPYFLYKIKKRKSDIELKGKEFSCRNQSPQQADSPMIISSGFEDSPYALFKIKKKTHVKSRISSCVDYSCNGSITTTPNKNCVNETDVTNKEDNSNSYQQSPNTVKLAVQKSMLDSNLTGDFSKPCILPTIEGRHPDLKTVSPASVASLLQESVSFNFSLIDCRYPYEYEGGHIKNAENIYMKEDIEKRLTVVTSATLERVHSKEILIFYCEFSSERGPSMLRYLRNLDRDMNRDFYPFLYYPELYVMEGGYKAFFSNFKELCYPQEYKRMLDKDCADQLAFYKSKCKSTRSTKRLKRTRSSLVF